MLSILHHLYLQLTEVSLKADIFNIRMSTTTSIIILCFLPLSRWTRDLEDLKEQRIKLLGDCLISSAFLSYVGAFSWEFRDELVYHKWKEAVTEKGIPMSDPFKLESLLTNDVEVSR